MKKWILAFLFSSLFIGSNAQHMWQIKKDAVVKWNYAFGDEFNEPVLDESKWMTCLPWGCAQMSADNVFRRENVELSGTSLRLLSKKEKFMYKLYDWEIDSVYLKKVKKPVTNPYEFNHTGGEVASIRKFKYGYFEIRFKSPGEYGIWPAFWLFGGEPNEEIDFFELKGERDDEIHVDAHCPDGCNNFRYGFLKLKNNWGGWIKTDAKLKDNWNIVSGEWQQDHIKWFLNGEPIAYFKKEYKTEQLLILGTGPAQTGYSFSPGPNATTQWPNVFEVDYVRVWTEKDTMNQASRQLPMTFARSRATMEQGEVYKARLKKKLKFAYDKKILSQELGTVTLLRLDETSYSLTFVGKEFVDSKIEIFDESKQKVKEMNAGASKYAVLDLSGLKKGSYTISITTLGKQITQEIFLNGTI